MSNLKKILALVLALVMSFSLVSVSSAAAYEDQDQIDPAYAEAVEVLSGIGIFQGDDLGNFNPKAPISRQEVAAMMYRVISMDTADKSDELYVDACNFSDVTANWAKGYIGYCANGGYIKGVGDNKFNPNGNISGVAVLAMILRAVGYDKNGEFTGSNWENEVLTTATSLGILSTVDETVGSLKKDASRELVAELIFRAMVNAKKVNYTLAFGYQPIVDVLQNGTTIGYDNFKLAYDKTVRHDNWGNPYHVWYKDSEDSNNDGIKTTEFNPVKESTYATIEYAAKATYNTAVCECDIAKALGIATKASVVYMTVNGNSTALACDKFDGTINAVHTNQMVGAQGRVTKFYKTTNGWEVVMMDEFLAQVTNVTEVVLDMNGHVKQYATLSLNVFDQGTNLVNVGTDITISAAKNWTYNVGEFVTLNLETNTVNSNATVMNPDHASGAYSYANLALANSVTGVQSALTTKASHWIDGTEYADNVRLHLDQAGNETTKHVWFFDTMGNVLGITDSINAYTFGTISAIAWKDSYTDLTKGYALAQITYIDGTSETVKIAKINGVTLQGIEGDNANYATGVVSSSVQYNEADYNALGEVISTVADYTNVSLYRIVEDAYGYKHLTKVTDLVDANVVTGAPFMGATVEGVNYHAGANTQFLVWTGAKYETYTGIQNVPTYYGNDESSIWVVDTNNDKIAEYVFVNEADLASAQTVALFYAHTDDVYGKTMYVTAHLLSNTQYYWTIHNGYVNGKPADIDVLDYDVVEEILANDGKLMIVKMTDGYVYDVEVVSGEGAYVGAPVYTYVTYAGTAAAASMGQNVLVTAGGSYDITNAEVIYDEYNLPYSVSNNLGYLYVVYTISPISTQKTASFVYVSNTVGEAQKANNTIDELIAATETAVTNLKNAITAANTYAAAAVTAEGLIKNIDAKVEALAIAYYNLYAALVKADNDADALTKALADVLSAEQKAKITNIDADMLTYLGVNVSTVSEVDGDDETCPITKTETTTDGVTTVTYAGYAAQASAKAAAKAAANKAIKDANTAITAAETAGATAEQKAYAAALALAAKKAETAYTYGETLLTKDAKFNDYVADAELTDTLANLEATVTAEVKKVANGSDAEKAFHIYFIDMDASITAAVKDAIKDVKTAEHVAALNYTNIWTAAKTAALVVEKRAAFDALDAKNFATKLTSAEWAPIATLISNAKTTIKAATTADAITSAKNTAIKAIDTQLVNLVKARVNAATIKTTDDVQAKVDALANEMVVAVATAKTLDSYTITLTTATSDAKAEFVITLTAG